MGLTRQDAICNIKELILVLDTVDLIKFPGYKVDRDGNIYGKYGKKLKPSINHNGYRIVNLIVNGKRIGAAVHTLIATAFLTKPENKSQVNHIDGNKENNKVENLEWVTPKENMHHAIHVLGFSPAQNSKRPVCAISASGEKDIISFSSVREAGEWVNQKYNVHSGHAEVWRAANGRRKSARGYMWKYIS